MNDLAIIAHKNNVAMITLNRPDARNALSLDLIEALRARVREVAAMGDVRVCVFAGAGRVFCAGMDLKAIIDDPGAPSRLLRGIAELTIEVRALPMVTIASVQGAAIGGGCGLMCVCDLGVTHTGAKIGYPEVDMGVCPAVVTPWLVEKIGAGRARAMLLMGGLLTGAEAHAAGLVTDVVEDASGVGPAVEAVVGRLLAAGPMALRATKGWLNESGRAGLSELVRRGAMVSAEVLSDGETRATLARAFAAR